MADKRRISQTEDYIKQEAMQLWQELMSCLVFTICFQMNYLYCQFGEMCHGAWMFLDIMKLDYCFQTFCHIDYINVSNVYWHQQFKHC